MSKCASLLAALLLLLLTACAPHEPELRLDGRRDLFLDGERVQLLEGYEGYTELVSEHDLWANPDRDELALPLFRNGRVRWNVGARPGRFVAGVARLGVGRGGDGTAAELVISAYVDGQQESVGRLVVLVPSLPVDPFASLVAWREGPATQVQLDLPQGADRIEIEALSRLPVPDGAHLALLSPRVIMEPKLAHASELPLRFDRSTLLTRRAEGEPPAQVAWALTRLAPERAAEFPDHADSLNGPSFLRPWVVEGSFSGQGARTALALLAGTDVQIQLPRIGADSRLRASVALDNRLAAGAAGTLQLLIDGEPAAAIPLAGRAWVPLDLALGQQPQWQGSGHRLTLRLLADPPPLGWVPALVADYAAGLHLPVEWQVTLARAGVSDLRVDVPVRVPRRLASASTPSVVLVHAETLRADVVGARDGRGRLIAPHLTALARAGRFWSRALAPSPWTVPSTATLLTGLSPAAHGTASHHHATLSDDAVTLAERLRDSGVVSNAVVTNDLLQPHAGWSRGFARYALARSANARQVVDLARSLLGAQAGSQQLLFLHLWDPHGPYNAPGAFRQAYVEPELLERDYVQAERAAIDALLAQTPLATDHPDMRLLRQRYLGDVAYLDSQLGALLEHLQLSGLAETTSVVLTSDHGEEFFEHGMFGHGSQLFDESTRVPLVLAPAGRWWAPYAAALAADAPGPVPGEDAVVSTGGLFSEVLDLMGVAHDADAVLPALTHATTAGGACVETEKGVALVGTQDPLRRRVEAARDDRGLLLVSWPVAEEAGADGVLPEPRLLFFDLEADPEARVPLPAQGPVAEALIRRLEAHRAWGQERALSRLEADLDLAALLQMGYLQRRDG